MKYALFFFRLTVCHKLSMLDSSLKFSLLELSNRFDFSGALNWMNRRPFYIICYLLGPPIFSSVSASLRTWRWWYWQMRQMSYFGKGCSNKGSFRSKLTARKDPRWLCFWLNWEFQVANLPIMTVSLPYPPPWSDRYYFFNLVRMDIELKNQF